MKMDGFASGAYEAQTRQLACDRLINMYVEQVPQGGKSRAALYPIHGVTSWTDLGEGPGRGIFFEDDSGRLFAVHGDTLRSITQDRVATALGTIALDSHPVYFATNGDGGRELLISGGNNGYVLDLATDVLTQRVTGCSHVGQIDGFFLALDGATSTLKISESYDGATWDPTQIQQRTAAPDPWRAMLVSRREIFLIGDRTGEVWFNAGASPFPFVQRPGAFFEVGIEAYFSLAAFGKTMAWLGRNGVVYWMNGYTPEAISTPALEFAIQSYKDTVGITDAIGWSYDRDGHKFYILSFPAAGRTWCYDATTNKWHQRGKYDREAGDFKIYRPQFHCDAFNKDLVCDSSGSVIYELSSSVFTDVDGAELLRVRRFPHLHQENKRIFFPWAELECQRGVGTANGQGVDPVVVLRASNDGGMTFGADRQRAVGKMGQYTTRVRWDQCGSSRDRVWELWASDPVATRWFDFHFEAEVGLH